MTSNIFTIQTYNSIMCGYFCIAFIEYISKGKSLVDFTNMCSPSNFKRNDNIMDKSRLQIKKNK